jgi:hypothetical protein
MRAPPYRSWIGLAVLLSSGGLGCTKDTPADPSPQSVGWPALPEGPGEARGLVEKNTRRPADAENISITAERVIGLLGERIGRGEVVGGLDDIVLWIWRRVSAAEKSGRSSYVLWGTYHDSGAQIDAFGDLVGPLGLSRLDAVCVEPFSADGRWSGIPAREQEGGSALLSAYLKTGNRTSLEKLLHGQVRENYTAWKYGILPVMMDLLIKARAADRRLCGCDMPVPLQERILESGMPERLRELHCVLALQEELASRPAPHRVAMLWGQGHLAPEGVQRFLPEDALVLSFYVFGGRFSDHGLERDLAGRVAVTDPLLIPVDGDAESLIVLLPDRWMGARKELKHISPEAPLSEEQRRRLVIQSSRPGTIRIGARSLEVSEEPRVLTLERGSHVFLFSHEGGLLAGAFTMPPDGFLELDLEPERRFVELILHRRAR